MSDPKPDIRPATPNDDAVLAELINQAGHGLALYLWSRLAEAGQSPWQVGQRREATPVPELRVPRRRNAWPW